MDIRRLGEVMRSPGKTVREIREGKVFVYPTDTVYGLGCNALNEESVKRIRKAKRSRKPFSVISPSAEWIERNLLVRFPEYMKKLPGPYTLIFRKRRKAFLREASPRESLGVRIPDHAFAYIVRVAGVPFVTTSANLSGEDAIASPDELPADIIEKTDILIDAGRLDGLPSAVIDLTGDEPRVLRSRA